MKINLRSQDKFESRHHGKDEQELQEMLSTVGATSLDELIDQTIPAAIRLPKPLNLPKAKSEQEFLQGIKKIARKNAILKSYIGTGYYDTITPNVILRNILENPAWYTAYTPYQAEIAQGRLEMLLNFQTVITDLTGMEIANASLLDEATAAAEAMTMLHALRPSSKKKANTFFVSELCLPQTIDLIYTRAKPIGIDVEALNRSFRFQEVLEISFSETEKTLINTSKDPQTEFYRMWTRKESLSKATGLGLGDRLDALPASDGLTHISSSLTAFEDWCTVSFDIDGNAIGSVTCRSSMKKNPIEFVCLQTEKLSLLMRGLRF